MATTLIMAYDNGSGFQSFIFASQGFFPTSSLMNSENFGSDETSTQERYVAGSITKLSVRVITGTTSGSSTVTLRKNGSNGNNTISIAQGATGFFTDSTPHTDQTVTGDLICISITPGDANFFLTILALTFTAAATSNAVTKLGVVDNFGSNNGGGTYSMCLGGSLNNNTSESRNKMRMLKTMTINNLGVLQSSGGANTDTIRSRKNSLNGNLTTTLTGSTQTLQKDTSNSDNVVSGDDWNLQDVHTQGNQGWFWASADFVDSVNNNTIFNCTNPQTSTFNTSVTSYFGLTGSLVSGSQTTESQAQAVVNNIINFTALLVNVNTNSITSNPSVTVTLRANGGTAGLTVSVANSTTGVFTDVSSADFYTSATTDAMNYKVATGAAGGSLIIQQIAAWGNIGGGAVATGPSYQHFDNSLKPSRQLYNPFGGQLIVFG